MSYPWDPAIGRLSRRAIASSAIDAIGRVILPLALFSVVYLGATRLYPWTRFFVPAVSMAGGVVVLLAALWGGWKGRHTRIYLAKWIDMTSQLEDRLTSAVDWGQLQTLDPFQKQCVDQLALQVRARAWPLVLPATRTRRLPIALASTAVMVTVGVIYLRRPQLIIDESARQKAVLPKQLVQAATQQASDLSSQSQALKDPELEQVTADLNTLLRDIDRGSSTKERSLASVERLRQKLEARGRKDNTLADLAARNDSGQVGALVRALVRGDTKGARELLAQLAQTLRADGLSENEMGDLEPLLRALGAVAKEVDPALAEQLNQAADKVHASDQQGAALRLTDASSKLSALARPLATNAAIRRAQVTTQAIEQALRDTAPGGAARASRAPEDSAAALQKAMLAAGVDSATGAGAAAGEHAIGKTPDNDANGPSLNIPGKVRGQVMRQLFDANNTATASEEVKKVLVAHDHVIEDRFRHDEVPLEYQDAVRAYFAALHAKGK
jgi:hypothetical protein